MSMKTHSTDSNGQTDPKSGNTDSPRSGNAEYEKFMKERQSLVASLVKETRNGQNRVKTMCKKTSQANLQYLEKAIEDARMHFHTASSGTGLDFNKIRLQFETNLTALGQQIRTKERDMNHKETKVAASELEHLFTKRSEDLLNWQQSLKAEQNQEIEQHMNNASREDFVDTTVKLALTLVDIPSTAFE